MCKLKMDGENLNKLEDLRDLIIYQSQNNENTFVEVLYDYDVLKDNGKISRKQAEEKAENEYIEFNKNQKITSDFDKLLLEANKLNNKK